MKNDDYFCQQCQSVYDSQGLLYRCEMLVKHTVDCSKMLVTRNWGNHTGRCWFVYLVQDPVQSEYPLTPNTWSGKRDWPGSKEAGPLLQHAVSVVADGVSWLYLTFEPLQ